MYTWYKQHKCCFHSDVISLKVLKTGTLHQNIWINLVTFEFDIWQRGWARGLNNAPCRVRALS